MFYYSNIYIISFGPESYLAPQKNCHRGIESSGSSEFSCETRSE